MKDDGTAAHGGQRFTDQETVGVAVGFLTGAYEEIYNALGYTTYLLVLHPSVQDQLHIEIEKYLENNPASGFYCACIYDDVIYYMHIPLPLLISLCARSPVFIVG